MTKPLPFTAAGIARAINGVQAAGKHVIGVRPDGTLIVGDNPWTPHRSASPPCKISPPPSGRTRGHDEHGNRPPLP